MQKRNPDRYRKRKKTQSPHSVTNEPESCFDTGERLLTAKEFQELILENGITVQDLLEWSRNGRIPVKNITQETVAAWMSGFAEIPNSVAKYLILKKASIHEKINNLYNTVVEFMLNKPHVRFEDHYQVFIKYPDAETYMQFLHNQEITVGMHNTMMERVHAKLVADDIRAIVINFDKEDYLVFLQQAKKRHSDRTLLSWAIDRGKKYIKKHKLFT
jgi:hypothetical protein